MWPFKWRYKRFQESCKMIHTCIRSFPLVHWKRRRYPLPSLIELIVFSWGYRKDIKMLHMLLQAFVELGIGYPGAKLWHHWLGGLWSTTEINSSLSCFKVSSAPVPSKFLGQDLVPLLELALTVEEGMELLKEFDRLVLLSALDV